MACSKFDKMKENVILDFPDFPHQPEDIIFPKRQFGKASVINRSFQKNWFKTWKWLHYIEDKDVVFCFHCALAHKKQMLKTSNPDASFIQIGFSNWKDATIRFSKHEQSTCHKSAMQTMVFLPKTTKDVGEQLNFATIKEKENNRQLLMKIIENIQFLARQGLPLRGDGDDTSSNFYQLMKLRGNDDDRIKEWMNKKMNKYTSPEIQNEILQIMGSDILNKIADTLHKTPFFTVMVDETADISNKEQVVVCFRWVSDTLDVHEDFVGLWKTKNLEANSIVQIIKEVLVMLNLSIHKCRGQCYDGAWAMCGKHKGVSKQILDIENRAVFTHCYGHALNLAVGDAVKGSKLMKDALDITQEICKLVKQSPRRNALLDEIQKDNLQTSPGIRVLCPTRWTVRADALNSILQNYDNLQKLWSESIEYVKDTDMLARIRGVSVYMNKFDFLFGLKLGYLILNHSDNLSKTLQKTRMSAAEGQHIAKLTVKTMKLVRTDDKFDLFWTHVKQQCLQLEDVNEPSLPRKRKRNAIYDYGNASPEFHENVENHYRQIYYEAIDNAIQMITDRFDQPGYKRLIQLENVLIKTANGDSCDEELKSLSEFYREDIQYDRLKLHLELFSANLPKNVKNIIEIKDYIQVMNIAERDLISEVVILLKLILVIPATNAVSERSFSALRRIKSYLRSTMKQERLNNLMLLHVHKNESDNIDLKSIANAFVQNKSLSHRLTQFGKFL